MNSTLQYNKKLIKSKDDRTLNLHNELGSTI